MNSEWRFSRKATAGACECGADGSSEFLPARRPLDEELGAVMELNVWFELKSFVHGKDRAGLKLSRFKIEGGLRAIVDRGSGRLYVFKVSPFQFPRHDCQSPS
jgi:hypothetical protein